MSGVTEEVSRSLFLLADAGYRSFHQKLIPGEDKLIGVRLPGLRKIARQIAKKDWKNYLDEAASRKGTDCYHEEIMLHGLVLGYADMSLRERKNYLADFIPRIRNWAICDSCVTGFRFMEKDRETWFEYLKPYGDSAKEFEVRFLIVSLMSHFLTEEYLDEVFSYCECADRSGYYAAMAVAWALSECYVRFPDDTVRFLKRSSLDPFTQNRAIQKIRESYRVTEGEKEYLKTLKK